MNCLNSYWPTLSMVMVGLLEMPGKLFARKLFKIYPFFIQLEACSLLAQTSAAEFVARLI